MISHRDSPTSIPSSSTRSLCSAEPSAMRARHPRRVVRPQEYVVAQVKIMIDVDHLDRITRHGIGGVRPGEQSAEPTRDVRPGIHPERGDHHDGEPDHRFAHQPAREPWSWADGPWPGVSPADRAGVTHRCWPSTCRSRDLQSLSREGSAAYGPPPQRGTVPAIRRSARAVDPTPRTGTGVCPWARLRRSPRAAH